MNDIISKTAILMLLFPIFYSVSCTKTEYPPMKPAKITIPDHELLKYTAYSGGEKLYDFYMLSRTGINAEWGKTVQVYITTFHTGSTNSLPQKSSDIENYILSNHSQYFEISMENGFVLESKKDFLPELKRENKTGIAEIHFQYQKNDNVVYYESKIWDGNRLKNMKNKVKIKPGYPMWEAVGIMLTGVRFMDYRKPGILYIVEPSVLKEAIPVYFHFIAEEKLNTPAGSFQTSKLGFTSSDPFIGKLMEPFSKSTLFWVEDSERGILVKGQTPDGADMVLQSINILESGNNGSKYQFLP